ncbi:MAG: acyltransferase family protein [Telluria sp.]
MTTLHRSTRVHGLDTLRALAVSLVVLHHYVLFVSGRDTFGWVGEMGWAGVDLFFALSGYLIGNQIFKAMGSRDGFSLRRFYARRFLRTLPNFYVVLALYFLWPAFRGGAPLLPLWKYLSFTQNIALEPGTAFSHAWSLSIEEQFYMLLPAVALAGAALGNSRRAAWLVIALAFGAGMLCRADAWLDHVQGQASWMHNYYKYVYYSSFCRFDELLAGVALAQFAHQQPALWKRLARHGNKFAVAGVGITAVACTLFLRDHYGFAVTVFGYPLLALGIALLVFSAAAEGSVLRETRVPGAGSLALWSYAIYLTHKQLCILIGEHLKSVGYDVESPAAIALMLLGSVAAGWLLYRVVETPFMKLRERHVPSNALRHADQPAQPEAPQREAA